LWQFFAALGLISLAGCATTNRPCVPKVETQIVVKTVQRPCPVTIPTRPAPLARPLPSDLERLAATLAGKLAEYTAPGGYADRASAALRTCTNASATAR